jgi:hypothetical protein
MHAAVVLLLIPAREVISFSRKVAEGEGAKTDSDSQAVPYESLLCALMPSRLCVKWVSNEPADHHVNLG